MGKQRPNPTDAARTLAALRRRVTRPCAVCGREMTGTTKRRTCSEACRSRAYRQRRDESKASEEQRL